MILFISICWHRILFISFVCFLFHDIRIMFIPVSFSFFKFRMLLISFFILFYKVMLSGFSFVLLCFENMLSGLSNILICLETSYVIGLVKHINCFLLKEKTYVSRNERKRLRQPIPDVRGFSRERMTPPHGFRSRRWCHPDPGELVGVLIV